MHLTNYSINKHSETYVESDNILEPNNATKRTITSLMLTLQGMGVDVEKLKANIKVRSRELWVDKELCFDRGPQ